MDFSKSLQFCSGVGEQLAKKFSRLELFTVGDLLLHFPRAYQNRSQIMPMTALQPAMSCLCQGEIVQVSTGGGRGRNMLTLILQDINGGKLRVTFFKYSNAQFHMFKTGRLVRCFGDVKVGRLGFEMVHPEIEIVNENTAQLADHYMAIYPSVEGLPQFRIRKIINPLLDNLKQLCTTMEDDIDALFKSTTQLWQESFDDLTETNYLAAVYRIHRPLITFTPEQLENCQTLAHRRLIIEELVAHRLALIQVKSQLDGLTAPVIKLTESSTTQDNNKDKNHSPKTNNLKEDNNQAHSQPHWHEQICANLPFELTDGQQRCLTEIAQNIQKPTPMMRLFQGDVGSGKTIVASMAIAMVIESGFQAAFMAPTELLARQHFATVSQVFEPLPVNVVLLTGKLTARNRKQIYNQIATQNNLVVIGTHALFQANVEFKSLGFVVIDEQHRFGVEQRLNLLRKGHHEFGSAHQLLLTATPIPRTLAMSLYGDIQQSILQTYPAGRQAIITSVLSNENLTPLVERIKQQCTQGVQIYWVCPFIEESEVIPAQSATERYEYLQQALPDVRIGLIHGRLKEDKKNGVMQSFRDGELDLLVATTVIEVGVDVPNASLIVIENAERMGLAQLHQLRGRVGRGHKQSYCILLYQGQLSERSKERLNLMRNSHDGFVLAEKDLQMRGSGEIVGSRQSGSVSFLLADFRRDYHLLEAVNDLSQKINNELPDIAEKLLNRWNSNRIELGKVG